LSVFAAKSVNILGAFTLLRKAPTTFVRPVNPSVRLAACISAALTGQISVIIGTGKFRENLLRKFKYG
jgi:hypothetical protein